QHLRRLLYDDVCYPKLARGQNQRVQRRSPVRLSVWNASNRWPCLRGSFCKDCRFTPGRLLPAQAPQQVLEPASVRHHRYQPAGRDAEHEGVQLRIAPPSYCTVSVTGSECCKLPELPETVIV